MSWLHYVNRDPVPWLLDPANPSARLLTLRDIFRRPEAALQPAQQALLDWPPMQAVLSDADRISFWGRAGQPYFGSALGNFGTLYLLVQLGLPSTPLIEAACAGLLRDGRLHDGRFAPPEEGPAPWFAYTGMALQTLQHFGFAADPRARSTQETLVQTICTTPQMFDCQNHGVEHLWGLVKVLRGLQSIAPAQRSADHEQAIQVITTQLLAQPFNLDQPQASWLQLHYPRYYESDLLELCHALAHSSRASHPRFQELLRHTIALQTPAGEWLKIQNAPGNFQVERMNHPSRWLTFEAVHTLMLVYGGNAYAT